MTLHQNDPVPLSAPPAGRTGRRVVAYGLGTALMLVSPLLVFAPAALFHCNARIGRRAAWGAFAIAAVLATLYFAQVANVSPLEGARVAYTSLAAVLLAIALPAMMTVPMVEARHSFGRVLVLALLISALGLGITELIMRMAGSFSPLAVHVAQAQQMGTELARSGSPLFRDAQRWTPLAVAVVPAMILIDIALVFLLSLLMYGRIASAWRPAAQPPVANDYQFRTLALPEWVLFAFLFGGITPVVEGALQRFAANTLAVVGFLYFLQGLAIFRALLVRAGIGLFGTIFAFLLLLVLTAGLGVLVLAVVGLFDFFFDFRRLKRKDDAHEGHTD